MTVGCHWTGDTCRHVPLLGAERHLLAEHGDTVRRVEKTSAALFFKYNSALGPPYRVLLDTNFINFSIKNKIDPVQGMVVDGEDE